MEDNLNKIGLLAIAAFLGAYFAGRRYMREKRWEAKYQAYRDIFESIHKLKYWSEQNYLKLHELPTRSSDKFKEMALSYSEAHENLWRYSHVAGITISDKSSKNLAELLVKIDSADFYYYDERNPDNYEEVFIRYFELITEAIDEHLPKITKLSKRDLMKS